MFTGNSFKTTALLVILLLRKYTNGESPGGCNTPDGTEGKCVSIYNCPHLMNLIRTENSSTYQFLRDSQCGVKNNQPVYVCCANVSKVGNTFVYDDCGTEITDRLIGGRIALLDEARWLALLKYNTNNFGCGGVLINQRYVLTAAHCVVEHKFGDVVSVRLGEWDISADPDCVTEGHWTDCAEPSVDVGIEKIIPHPNYATSPGITQHDLALIKLNVDVKYSDFIQPICIPKNTGSNGISHRQKKVAGWGYAEHTSSTEKKLKSTYLIVPCNHTNHVDMICAVGNTKDDCTADSGGPLMGFSTEAIWFVEGIASIDPICGTENVPGVYTNISLYYPWIYENTQS